MTSLHSAISRRFPTPEWTVLYEVRDDAGFKAHRSGDVVAMNTWPSRGLALHGMEIKTYRGDWLRELAQPDKSVAIQQFCEHWWLVTNSVDDVAKLEELPEKWGWLALYGKKLRTMKDAPRLKPKPITKGFLAALLRNATKGLVPSATIAEAVEEKLQDRIKREHIDSKAQFDRTWKQYTELREAVKAFKESSGIDIEGSIASYTYPRIDLSKLGTVVRRVLGEGSPYGLRELEYAQRNVQNAAERLEELIEAVKGLEPKKEEQGAAQ